MDAFTTAIQGRREQGMTKEEQTDWLCRLRAELNSRVIDTPWNKKFTEALTGILERETCEDAINREAVINHICESKDCYKNDCKGRLYKRCHDLQWVYELPPVNPNKWIPLKTRPMTDEESTFFRDWAEYGAELFDCPLPDDGQEVLVSWGGNVCIDTFVRDDRDGCYFEGVDIGDVEAWQPLPKPYEPQERIKE